MNNPDYDIQSSCGGKRRGCCIIELPHDEQPDAVAGHSCTQRILLLVSGLSIGGSPIGAVVSIPNPEATYELGKAAG